MTMLPIPPDEQPGLAEEWAEPDPTTPTPHLRPKKREKASER